MGGVIIDLSVDATLNAFSAMSGFGREKINQIYNMSPEFLLYEKGMIDDDEFRDFVNRALSIKAMPNEIDIAWSAMILGIPRKKLELLERLRGHFKVLLLSNTNAIHLTYINQVILPAVAPNVTSLDPYFDRAYYSHLMKKRKPDADIFEEVLAESNLLADETLFLDDNRDNITGADKLGIRTALVNTPNFILDYFDEY